MSRRRFLDPIKFKNLLWPHIDFYDKQIEIIYSVVENDETYVPAGHELGKDFVTAFIALWFFSSRDPCRVITTSVDAPQLEGVLWGEMKKFIDTAKYRLPLIVNHLHIKKVIKGKECPLSYIKGRVASKGEGLAGHHIANIGDGVPRTLFISDEASGVDDESYEKGETWANRILVIGNPYPCENFFSRNVALGDIPRKSGKGFTRRIIEISALDSPNVKLALAKKIDNEGIEPEDEILIPGVKSYSRFLKHESEWDEVKKCIGLYGKFFKGAQNLLFPPIALNLAEEYSEILERTNKRRVASTIGVDPAEGGDNTTFTAVDDEGLIDQESIKTPDTTRVLFEMITFAKKHGITEEQLRTEEKIFIDAGGGGKEHADYARLKEYKVVTIGFGQSPTVRIKDSMNTLDERINIQEERYSYKNRRAEMYGILSTLLEVYYNDDGTAKPARFGIPRRFTRLRKQLAVLPRLYNKEGELYLPPKNKVNRNSKEKTLIELIGHSPDEADSLVLAVFGLKRKMYTVRLGIA